MNRGRAALLGVVVALFALPFARTGRDLLDSDWTPIYIGGRLLLSDPVQLYDRAAQLHQQAALLGPGSFSAPGQGALLPFVFPPWVALLAAPLTGVGPEWGGRAWMLLNTAALLAGLLLLTRERWSGVAAFAGVPAALMVANGQADGLVVLGMGLAWWLHERGRPLPAGLALGLTLAKPHLVVALALGLLLARRWQVVAGWALAALLVVGAAELRDASLVPGWIRSTAAVAGASRYEVGLPAIGWAFVPALALPIAAVGSIVVAGYAAWRRSAAALVAGSMVSAIHALGSDLTLVSAGLALGGRATLWPLLALSVGSAAYALLHQPLLNAAFSLALGGLVLWLGQNRQPDQESRPPQHDR